MNRANRKDRPEFRQRRAVALFAWGIFSVLAALAVISPALAQGPVLQDIKSQVSFDQKLSAQVPPDLMFRDANGETVKLGDYFGARPIILTLNYYHCPNLCSLELEQLTDTLADLPFNLGDEFQVVTVSIDPREAPVDAAGAKSQYVRRYARPGRGEGWHFLTGDRADIDRLTQAVGFHYAYDPKTDEFAHPTGVIVLTPQGQVSRYLYGVDYPSNDLRLALVEASQGKIGSVVDQVLLLCFHYDPANGRYSSLILTVTQWVSVATVLVMVAFLGWLWRKDLKKTKG